MSSEYLTFGVVVLGSLKAYGETCGRPCLKFRFGTSSQFEVANCDFKLVVTICDHKDLNYLAEGFQKPARYSVRAGFGGYARDYEFSPRFLFKIYRQRFNVTFEKISLDPVSVLVFIHRLCAPA